MVHGEWFTDHLGNWSETAVGTITGGQAAGYLADGNITFIGEVPLSDDRVTLKLAEISELSPGALIGHLSFDSGYSGPVDLPIYEMSQSSYDLVRDFGSTLLMLAHGLGLTVSLRLTLIMITYEITEETDGSFSLTTGSAINIPGQTPTATQSVSNKTSLGTVAYDAGEATVSFATHGSDVGFRVDGNSVYLKDGFYF